MNDRLLVIYNGACPICAHEIDHYRVRAKKASAPLDFLDLATEDPGRFGVGCDMAARRLHVVRADGTLTSGMPAFRMIWSRLPGLRWLADAAELPVLGAALEWAYDRIAAPALYRLHLRREADREVANAPPSS